MFIIQWQLSNNSASTTGTKRTSQENVLQCSNTLTVIQPLLAIEQISTHPGRILLRSQRVLDAVDEGTEVVQGLKDLGSLVQHGKVSVLIKLWIGIKQSL